MFENLRDRTNAWTASLFEKEIHCRRHAKRDVCTQVFPGALVILSGLALFLVLLLSTKLMPRYELVLAGGMLGLVVGFGLGLLLDAHRAVQLWKTRGVSERRLTERGRRVLGRVRWGLIVLVVAVVLGRLIVWAWVWFS